jgi:hypothetical protein
MTRTDPRWIAVTLVVAAITGAASFAATISGFSSGADQSATLSPLTALAALFAFGGLLRVRATVRVRR